MNRIVLMGRLTGDPILKYSQNKNLAVARYGLAVDKRFPSTGGSGADFFQVVSFGRKAEFAAKYLHKGIRILVSGSVNTGSYTSRDGQDMAGFEVVAEAQEFAESKAANEAARAKTESGSEGWEYMGYADGDEAVPFD